MSRTPRAHRLGVALLAWSATTIPFVGNAAHAQSEPPPVTVTLDPSPVVPYQQVTVTASGEGCDQPTNQVEIGNNQPTDGTYVDHQPPKTVTVPVDGSGHWTATVTFPRAYPGGWAVYATCGPGFGTYSIPSPSGMKPTVTRTSATVSETTSISGAFCAGGHIEYTIAPDVYNEISNLGPKEYPSIGSITPAANGSWTGSIAYTGVNGTGAQKLRAWCAFDDGAVIYSPAVDVTVNAKTQPTQPTTPSTPATPVKVTPRFTG